ncbi:MAG: RNase adaptor protein RapZ [Actinobacteria bacterium]|nr:RNase adaptor protein RapZ [Actinomycetota bacterium]
MSEFLIITGMSGAGRSQAADTFEDLGWFVIDNLPPALMAKVTELVQSPGSTTERVALVVGTGQYFDELSAALEQLRRTSRRVRVLFLEASDNTLIRRYENTRRRHPLGESDGLLEGIQRERVLLEAVKSEADVVVDTSDLNVHQLRDRLLDLFARDAGPSMQTSVVSFGYKHGLPLDVDLVLDCRFLPNPHWVDDLRPLTTVSHRDVGR